MSAPEDLPELKMAAQEPLEDLARRVEHEQRASLREREDALSGSLGPFRVGSVPHFNAVPLTRGLEEEVQYAPPSELAKRLRAGELDAALISVTEVLLSDRYDVLDGVSVASLGEVKSVFLAHRKPLEEATVVYCEPTSLTGRHLLQVLLAERGVRPEFRPLEGLDPANLPDYLMLIGDVALDFQLDPGEHAIWDLGSAWYETTGLPFVYAVWALRRGMESGELRRKLRAARAFGMETLDHIIQSERPDIPLDLRKDYLSWHIHFHLGPDERRGMARFGEYLEQEGLGPVYPPHFVA